MACRLSVWWPATFVLALREMSTMAAMPTSAPIITKSLRVCALTSIPARKAASRDEPMASVRRPKRVLRRTTHRIPLTMRARMSGKGTMPRNLAPPNSVWSWSGMYGMLAALVTTSERP